MNIFLLNEVIIFYFMLAEQKSFTSFSLQPIGTQTLWILGFGRSFHILCKELNLIKVVNGIDALCH